MAQTKSPNCQGKKKQSTLEFTKEKTTLLLPTKSTSNLPRCHRLNGKKAKTTGTTPPRNMDEDELDLTQVNMDIGVEVNPEEVAPGMQVTVAANNGETNVATRAIVVAGEAGTQAVEVTRDELTRVVLAAGSQNTKATPIRGRNLEGQFNKPNTHKIKGIKVAASGIFPELAADNEDITSLQCGKHNLRTLISTHSGTSSELVARTTTVLVIGDKPGKTKVDKTDELRIPIITYGSLISLIKGNITWSKLQHCDQPEITTYLEGFSAPMAPPEIQCKQSATKGVTFSNLKARKHKEVPKSPESPAASKQLVENLVSPRGMLDTSKVKRAKYPLYISVVSITLRIPSGKVTELTTELMLNGLKILCSEDKKVCFLHPDDFGQQAKKRADMPEKFQKIFETWAVFDQPLSRFKNDIRENRRRTYSLSIWLGSKKKIETIINGCTLDWDNKQKSGGFVKIAYKWIQSLNTGKNLILVGVPTDTCANSLQQVLRTKMEEAREKMVKRNPYKYGTINKVPHFVLERNFVKNTPYAKRSKEDNIPFWLHTPYHPEYVLVMEEQLELILHYMYCSKRFQILFGEAAFYYKNPGMEALGSE
jgi:hypothetical protein